MTFPGPFALLLLLVTLAWTAMFDYIALGLKLCLGTKIDTVSQGFMDGLSETMNQINCFCKLSPCICHTEIHLMPKSLKNKIKQTCLKDTKSLLSSLGFGGFGGLGGTCLESQQE